MWNYSFEIPTLSILAIILAFYFSRPRLPVRKNITFIYMIVIETLIIILDVIATEMDNDYALYSIILMKILNMLYFIAFFDRAYIMYLFSISVLKDSLQNGRLIKKLIIMPLIVGIIISIISMITGSADSSMCFWLLLLCLCLDGHLEEDVRDTGYYFIICSYLQL